MIELNHLEDTKKFGIFLGQHLFSGAVLCLNGNLGAGKTTLTKSIAQGMGIRDYVTSPTFTIVNEYYGPLNLYHMDTYRLEGDMDVDYLGFDEYFYGDGVVIVEWADKITEALPEEYLTLELEGEQDHRRIKIKAVGEKYKKLKELLYENFGN